MEMRLVRYYNPHFRYQDLNYDNLVGFNIQRRSKNTVGSFIQRCIDLRQYLIATISILI